MLCGPIKKENRKTPALVVLTFGILEIFRTARFKDGIIIMKRPSSADGNSIAVFGRLERQVMRFFQDMVLNRALSRLLTAKAAIQFKFEVIQIRLS